MRVSSGIFKGREIRVPKHGVIPTTEMLRQAVMNRLRPVLNGARVIDLFAGSGALGIEMLSNGAAFAVFVENNPAVYHILKENLNAIVKDGSCYRAFRHNAAELTPDLINENEAAFDIVFADPFYKDTTQVFEPGYDFAMTVLKNIGLFILEHASKIKFEKFKGFEESRKYGDTSLSFFKKGIFQ